MGGAERRWAEDQAKRRGAQAALTSLLDEQLERREELAREAAAAERAEVSALPLPLARG